MQEERKLTKKERKQLRKQERQQKEVQSVKASAKWKWFVIGAVVALLIGSLAVVIYKVNQPPKPLPGLSIKELGRDHITDISGITYSSNPPTSGSHFNAWAKRGVYTTIISDGYLIHSLEHGYIVLSYNCGVLAKKQTKLTYKKGDALTTTSVDAKALMAPFTPDTMPENTELLPEEFNSQRCKALVKDLSSFLKDFQRIVIVPRTNLDAPVVLTAWGRMEKFDAFDKENMREFIAAFHNAGPEQTME